MPVDIETLYILHYPAPVLRSRAEPIDNIDQQVKDVAARMMLLMGEAEGLGLAAPQIGLSWRMFIARDDPEGDPARVYINPTLENLSPTLVSREEGCLSLPGINADILRSQSATITAQDLDGNEFVLSSDELLARVWQHEFDHIQGILITDRMSKIDRIANRKPLKELVNASKT